MPEHEICRMYLYAKSPAQQIGILADLNGCSSEEIKQVLRNNGINLVERIGKRWTEEEAKKLKSMIWGGQSFKQAAEEFRCSISDVVSKYYMIIGLGWENKDNISHQKYRRWNRQEAETLKELVEKGMSLLDIARIMKRDRYTIKKHICEDKNGWRPDEREIKEDEIKRIVALSKSGMTIKDISKEVGRCKDAVRKYIRLYEKEGRADDKN